MDAPRRSKLCLRGLIADLEISRANQCRWLRTIWQIGAGTAFTSGCEPSTIDASSCRSAACDLCWSSRNAASVTISGVPARYQGKFSGDEWPLFAVNTRPKMHLVLVKV